MKEKLVLSVLVDNESGVLQRVASLFSRRSYNISSLTVSETEDEKFSVAGGDYNHPVEDAPGAYDY